MKKIITIFYVAFTLFASNLYAYSQTYNAKCTLVIDGKTYMNGKCSYLSDKYGDQFDDLRTKAICPNGADYGSPQMNCSMAELTILSSGIFGSLERGDNGVANFCWNGGGGMHAQDCYSGLTRKGACWSSDSARSQYSNRQRKIELCAWK